MICSLLTPMDTIMGARARRGVEDQEDEDGEEKAA